MKMKIIFAAALLACGQVIAQTMDWSYGKPGRVVVTQEQDVAAMAAISALTTQGFTRVHDSAKPSRYFMGISDGTGTVYEVTGPFTNLMVTLSDDFEETTTHTRPAWTNNVYPFTDGDWRGLVSGNLYLVTKESPNASWSSEAFVSIPLQIFPLYQAQGTATVSVASIYYTTNVFAHFTTEAELEAAKAACGVVLTNTVTSATNAFMPYSRTVYGDVSTTNETGYAAFNATNAAVSSYASLIPSAYVGTVTNTYRRRLDATRKFGVLTNTAWFVKGGFGAGYKAVSTVVSVKDAAGNVLASSASQPVNIDQTVTTQAAITNTLTIPENLYSGIVDVACIAVSTNASSAVLLYTGGQYASSLSFGEAPIPYATVGEVSGLRLGGATNITDGVTSGTYNEATRTFDISAITKKITKPILSSATNIVVASTNSVYYVPVTTNANIAFDFSALALGGTNRADITAIIDCLNTQALYSVIATNNTVMDCAWEPTVTGRYELVVSSDGVRTTASQMSPIMCFFAPALIAVDFAATTYGPLFTALMPSGTLSREVYIANENNPRELAFLRLAMSFGWPEVDGHLSFVCGSSIIGEFSEWSSVTNAVFAYPSGANGYKRACVPMRPAAAVSGFALPTRFVRVIKDVDDSRATTITSATIRRMNALERAAYNAGAYPSAFRLDY